MDRVCEYNSFIALNDLGSWSSRPSTFQHPAMIVLEFLLYNCGVALGCGLICVRFLVDRPWCSSFGAEYMGLLFFIVILVKYSKFG